MGPRSLALTPSSVTLRGHSAAEARQGNISGQGVPIDSASQELSLYLWSAACSDQIVCSSGKEATPNWDQSDEMGSVMDPGSAAAGPRCTALSSPGSEGACALREACSATSDPTLCRVRRRPASCSRCSGDTRPGRAPGCGCPALPSPPGSGSSSAMPGAMVVHRYLFISSMPAPDRP